MRGRENTWSFYLYKSFDNFEHELPNTVKQLFSCQNRGCCKLNYECLFYKQSYESFEKAVQISVG